MGDLSANIFLKPPVFADLKRALSIAAPLDIVVLSYIGAILLFLCQIGLYSFDCSAPRLSIDGGTVAPKKYGDLSVTFLAIQPGSFVIL